MHRIRIALIGGLAAVAMAVAAVPASAQTNNQSGLVNVILAPNLLLQVPASVAVPVSVAANVCGINVNVLATQAQNGPVMCTAQSDSTALNTAVANAITSQGSNSSNNNQSGLVNVILLPSPITIQVPASVSVPIGVAANVCGVNANVLAQQAQTGSAMCTATSTSQALSNAIADAMSV